MRTPHRRIRLALVLTISLCLFAGIAKCGQKDTADDGNVEMLLDALDGEDGILPEGLDLELEADDEFGQEEEVSLEEFLEEEMEFFKSRDEDESGGLSLDEFKVHFLQSLSEAGELHPDPATGEKPNVEQKVLGEEDEQHAEWAFREFDVNRDGSVTWEEWRLMMFHEAPQEPEYVDGKPSKEKEDAHLKSLFREWDKDHDGQLDKIEIVEMFRSHRREAMGEPNEEPITDDEIEMVTWQVFEDKDSDKDRKLSLAEWMEGGAYF